MILKGDELVFTVHAKDFRQSFTSFAAAAGCASALEVSCFLDVTAQSKNSSWTATMFHYKNGSRSVCNAFAVNQVVKHTQGF